MRRGPIVFVLIVLQLGLLVAGLFLTIQWARGAGVWRGPWANLPMVGILLSSLLVFSFQEARWGVAGARRKKGDPESMGGWLEAMAFGTWLLLIVHMIATVFKAIRALKTVL